ncbi:MAG: VWA domain-containing protein, partial [Candidatus Sulfotelmatobacter sp.]
MKSFFCKNIFPGALLWFIAVFAVAGLHGAAMSQSTTAASAQSASQAPTSAATQQATSENSSENNSSDHDSNTGDVPRIRVGINEVNVVFTVTDKHGKRVTDLKENDFRIVDDNKPPAEIRSFHAEANLPLQVGLLIDASNSVRDRFKFEQQSAVEFLNQIIRRGYDQAMVVGFDVTPEVAQDFTDDSEKLAHGVRELRPGGGTAMYDALYFACRDKLLKKPQNGPTRRAIILLSDGDDNQSHVSMGEAVEMAQRAETIVYTISTNVSGTKGPGDKVLERIADATG